MIRIEKVNIENFKCFKGMFSLSLNPRINTIVENNEAGKSTILEAIHLTLSGILGRKYLRNELSQYSFNHEVVKAYIESLTTTTPRLPPHILIEVFFDTDQFPTLEGNGNSQKAKGCGVQFKIEFDPEYHDEYEVLIKSGNISTIPIEYYKTTWKSFARESITARSIPMKSVLIDSSSARYQNGSDIYISRIIRDDLEDSEKVAMSQEYRRLKQEFMLAEPIKAINEKIKTKSKVTEKDLKVSVDLSTQNSWESTLMTYLDETPFHQIGKGEQCIIKTNLALGHKKSKEANLILIEEPESHLSHSKLNQLIASIEENCEGKQIIISTHSSFVANKLGLEHLILLNNPEVARLKDLPLDTQKFFKKLPGYQTLRLLLCRKALLVEGDSDELIVQKAYMTANKGRLPIEDGIDVISVKLTFKRFLEVAQKLKLSVAVITDNDGNYDNNITKKYKGFKDEDTIKIFADIRNELNTLEPQFFDANKTDPNKLCRAIGINHKIYNTEDKIIKYMIDNKTSWALKVFDSGEVLEFPKYIQEAVRWCNE